jgi:hypothetical protein
MRLAVDEEQQLLRSDNVACAGRLTPGNAPVVSFKVPAGAPGAQSARVFAD